MASQHSVDNDDVDDAVDYSEDQDDDLDDDVTPDLAGKGKAGTTEDVSLAARHLARDELSRQVAEFLARGGRIREIPSGCNTNRPKKPVSDFGDRSL